MIVLIRADRRTLAARNKGFSRQSLVPPVHVRASPPSRFQRHPAEEGDRRAPDQRPANRLTGWIVLPEISLQRLLHHPIKRFIEDGF